MSVTETSLSTTVNPDWLAFTHQQWLRMAAHRSYLRSLGLDRAIDAARLGSVETYDAEAVKACDKALAADDLLPESCFVTIS